jgi:predicted restriction endonuclease
MDITWESVQQAIAEHDRLGAQAFLGEYGFRPARRYWLTYNGREYDSKAIVGVAHGYATGRFWRAEDFVGGHATVVRRLRELNFEIRESRSESPLSQFGEVAGYPPGSAFASRREVHDAGVHRPLQAGICGRREFGAESIVVSGGYEDDKDYGDLIIYTGHGGQDAAGRQVSDQSYEDSGNAALRTSSLTGVPVRVIRGAHRDSQHAPDSGFRYDGLFRVVDTWQAEGKRGKVICRFRLEAVERPTGDEETILYTDIVMPSGTKEPGRRATFVQRLVRSTRVADSVKKLYNHTCQICATRLEIAGQGVSEGAHIRALGHGHRGPDEPGNVLCLCPNCHTLFDKGALIIDADFVVWRNGVRDGSLRRHNDHAIDPAHLTYHRDHYANVGRI